MATIINKEKKYQVAVYQLEYFTKIKKHSVIYSNHHPEIMESILFNKPPNVIQFKLIDIQQYLEICDRIGADYIHTQICQFIARTMRGKSMQEIEYLLNSKLNKIQ